jgi:hypothetical protein
MKTNAQIFLTGNLSPYYSASGMPVSYSTNPTGLSAVIYYNNSTSIPVNTGRYRVSGYINDTVYTGNFTGWYNILPCFPTISIQSVPEIYNGEYQQVIYSTIPSGLNVDLLYTGIGGNHLVPAPINVGYYGVDFIVDDPNSVAYTGNYNFFINPKYVNFSFGDLTVPFNKKPQPIKIYTDQDGVGLEVYYNGEQSVPVETGIYNVQVRITDPNYASIEPVNTRYFIVGRVVADTFSFAWGSNSYNNINIPYNGNSSGLFLVSQKPSTSETFSAMLTNDNTIVTWGSGNAFGQQNIPIVNNYIKDVKTNFNSTFILDVDGNLTGCGYMFNSGFVPKLSGIIDFDITDTYGIAILPSGFVTGWGESAWGNFHTGCFGYINITSITTNNNNCLGISGGSVRGWGNTSFGQLSFLSGNSATLRNVKKVVSSDYGNLLLFENGNITGHGWYIDGLSDKAYPLTIPTNISGVMDISMSDTNNLIITSGKIQPPIFQPVCTGYIYDS